jgi:glutamate N-acetyltransferase/amino-acid N-acetyltransferase
MAKPKFKETPGGVCGVRGVTASGISCGMKAGDEPDLALVVSEAECNAAAFYTTNKLQGAHISVFKKRLAISGNNVIALLVNAKIANCSTGVKGVRDSNFLCNRLALDLGVPAEQVLHASTGVIGRRLPVDRIAAALPALCNALSPDGGDLAARAIMTTDAAPKSMCIRVGPQKNCYNIGGMAKGAGMIHPNMATMLSFIYTDARISAKALEPIARRVMDKTFNCISIDNDMSPNDTFAVFANGLSGIRIGPKGRPQAEFEEALEFVCAELARRMVLYGEGVTKVVTIETVKAKTRADAETMARAIANSQLVKTAIFGSDPNWGRILSAACSCGADIDPAKAVLKIDGHTVFEKGEPVECREPIMQGKDVHIRLNANAGKASARRWTGDLSIDYVKINAEYTT